MCVCVCSALLVFPLWVCFCYANAIHILYMIHAMCIIMLYTLMIILILYLLCLTMRVLYCTTIFNVHWAYKSASFKQFYIHLLLLLLLLLLFYFMIFFFVCVLFVMIVLPEVDETHDKIGFSYCYVMFCAPGARVCLNIVWKACEKRNKRMNSETMRTKLCHSAYYNY